MYDQQEILFDEADNLKWILTKLDNEIFNNKKYQNYYGITKDEVISQELWIGTKPNKYLIIRSTQSLLGHMAVLIDRFYRVCVKEDLYIFNRLKKKRKDRWTNEDKGLYEDIKKRIVYADHRHQLIRNPKFENKKSELILNKIKLFKTQLRRKNQYLKNFNSILKDCNINQFKETVQYIQDYKYDIILIKEKIYDLIDQYYLSLYNR
jgi:hypothetical protein